MPTLRLRQTDNLYTALIRTSTYQKAVGSASECKEFAYTAAYSSVGSRCLGTTKVVYDYVPSYFNPSIPSFRDFEVRSGSGGCDSTKLTISIKNSQCPNWRQVYVMTGDIALQNGGWSYDLSAVTTDSNRAQVALSKAWQKVTSPEIDFGENLATMAQTLEMIKNPLKGVASLLRKMAKAAKHPSRKTGRKRGEKRDTAKSALELLENQWLQYRYGIMPLVLDVNRGIELYNDKFLVKSTVKVARGSAPSDKTEAVVHVEYGAGYPNCFQMIRQTTTTTAKVRACIYHQNVFGDENLPSKLRMFGLHPDQLGNLAWNLLPLSFVVDWIWDVSGWIAARSPVADKILWGNTVSFKYERTIKRVTTGFRSASVYTKISGSPCSATGMTRKYKRVTNWPYTSTLSRGTDLSTVNRNIDAIALTLQNIPRVFRR